MKGEITMKNIKIGIALLGAVGLLSIGIPALTMARSNNGDMHGFMGFHLGQAAITGTVASISGNTITLTGSNSTTYTVDASNAQLMIVKPAGTSIANSGIQVGDTLSVMGTITGTNIVATKIMDGAKNIHLGD